MTVEERLVAADLPTHARCLAGQNACPPEDVCGPSGYAEFLRALAGPSDEMHERMIGRGLVDR